MKAAFFTILAASMLAGCQHKLTLEEAQEQCMKSGGMLMIVYTQEITLAGAGEQVASPGDCVSASKFDAPAAKPPAN